MKVHKKAELVIDPAATRSLARLSTEGRPTNAVDLSAAHMLSQLHGIAGALLSEVQLTESEPLAKRIAMAKDLAKLLPMLAQAERKVRKGWRNKDVEDMTDAELRQARKALKAR